MTACQRWSPGRVQSWRRPEDGGFDPARYGVVKVVRKTAKAYVTSRHYSGTYVAARLPYGLYDLTESTPRLVGVAALSVPTSKRVLTGVFPGLEPYQESLELGRFVLDDNVAANGESWFLGQVFRLAAEAGIRGIVSFSDPMPRRTLAGDLVMPGHIGTIYQATNATYTGRATPRTLKMMRDGTVFSDRACQKVRKQERGHEYAEKQLVAFGARPRRAGESPKVWLADALAAVDTRPVRHHGNHRYAFRLGTGRRERATVRVALPSRPYPKVRDVEREAVRDAQAAMFPELAGAAA
jgi:hypothetical protein